ncbi:MAG: hypothetical protein OXF74_12880 [Rhodobacteraceae bacterium]|nr:hypothetical protein [Paracoccaceae bacterium]
MQKKRFSELVLDEIALRIHDAVKSGERIEAPSKSHAIDYGAAVEIRRRMANLLGRYSGMPLGYKLAFTSPATQRLLGFDGPEFGHLFTEFELEYGVPVDTSRLCDPHAEPEIAFIMGSSLVGPDVTVEDVIEATECITSAIEIVDSRIGMDIATNVDMVADNVQFGRILLGPDRFDLREHDLTSIPVSITVDDQHAESNTGHVMGHPAAAVAWLAERFAMSNGRDGAIEKGDVILSGSCTQYFPVKPGSKLTAEFGPLGRIDMDFV